MSKKASERSFYGVSLPRYNRDEAELFFYAHWDKYREYSKMERWQHFKLSCIARWPALRETWNEWLDDQIKSAMDEVVPVKTVVWTGCATAGKTFAAGLIAFQWWSMQPSQTAVIITSTTGKMVRVRIWPVIQRLFYEAQRDGERKAIGNLVDSQTKLQSVHSDGRKDDKHAIRAIAVAEGETIKAVNDIKGIHAKRMMVIVDEAESTPEAIFGAVPNIRKGCSELILIVIGNSNSRIDPHGRIAEPVSGWKSINVSSERWNTKGVPGWQIPPGVCLHFDGHKSPNVKAGRTLWPFLYSLEDYHNSLDDRVQESLSYWCHDRGFWPPAGMEQTVLDEATIEKYDGRGKLTFQTVSHQCSFLDPAFGGDACRVVFGRLGDIEPDKLALQIDEAMTIPITADSKHEVDFQVAARWIEECGKRGVEPRYAGMDATGIGRGVYAIVARQWGPQVWRGEWGARASDRPAGAADLRPGHEVYANAVTEMWFGARDAVVAELLKGLYDDAVKQFCTRHYEKKSTVGGRYILEDKKDYRSKRGRSPDDGDAIAGLVEVARRNGLVLTFSSNVPKGGDDWDKVEDDIENLNEGCYTEENEPYDREFA